MFVKKKKSKWISVYVILLFEDVSFSTALSSTLSFVAKHYCTYLAGESHIDHFHARTCFMYANGFIIKSSRLLLLHEDSQESAYQEAVI